MKHNTERKEQKKKIQTKKKKGGDVVCGSVVEPFQSLSSFLCSAFAHSSFSTSKKKKKSKAPFEEKSHN
jgi:hypothetical protein